MTGRTNCLTWIWTIIWALYTLHSPRYDYVDCERRKICILSGWSWIEDVQRRHTSGIFPWYKYEL